MAPSLVTQSCDSHSIIRCSCYVRLLPCLPAQLTHAHAHTSARSTRSSIQPYTHTLLPIKMLDVRVADLAIAVGAVWGLEQPVNWLGRTRWPVLAGHVQIAQSCVPPVCCGTPQHGSLSSFFSIRYNIDARRRLADGQPPHHTTHSTRSSLIVPGFA